MFESTFNLLQPDPENQSLLEEARAYALASQPEAVSIWHSLNAIAEPSWQEAKTSQFVEDFAARLQIPVLKLTGSYTRILAITGTGKGTPAPVLGYKVDLDALEFIQKDGSILYKNSCFHSGHQSIALKTAEFVWKNRHRFSSKIFFIFQTAEETPTSGATELLESELFKSLKIERMIALHASPEYRYDEVGFCAGPAQAGINMLRYSIEVDSAKLNSQHIAQPHNSVNPAWALVQLLSETQQAVYQVNNPVEPLLFNLSQLGSDNWKSSTENVVPRSAGAVINFRYFNPAVKTRQLEKIAACVAALETKYEHTLKVRLEIEPGPPPVYNDPALTSTLMGLATEVLGVEKVLIAPKRMGGDDMANYSQVLPAVIFRLGTGNPEKGINKQLHNEDFTVDENCFYTGIAVMSYSVMRLMGVE